MGEEGIVQNTIRFKNELKDINYAEQDIPWPCSWLGMQCHYFFDTTECPYLRLGPFYGANRCASRDK